MPGGNRKTQAGAELKKMAGNRGVCRRESRRADSYCDQTRTRLPSSDLVVDDERRTVPLEVLDAKLEVLQVHAVAVEVDVAALGFEPQEPERDGDANDAAGAAIVRIVGEDVELFWDPAVRRRGSVGIRLDEVAVAVELNERLLSREALPDFLEIPAGGGCRRFVRLDVLREEVEPRAGHGNDADDDREDQSEDDPDPRLDSTGHLPPSPSSALPRRIPDRSPVRTATRPDAPDPRR